MTRVVSGLLREPAFVKQLENSTMFAVKLSEMMKDRNTNEKIYTNYQATIFAKTQPQIDYYMRALSEGSFIVVSCDQLKIEQREYQGRMYTNLNMENARLMRAHFDQNQQQGQTYQPAQQQSTPNGQQSAQGQGGDFESDIPF